MPRDRPRVPRDVIFFDFLLFLGGLEPYFFTFFCEFPSVVLVWCCMVLVLVWCGASAVAVLAEGIGILTTYEHISKQHRNIST